ncbi:MAG: endonuclease domain-containing protein [Bacteroidota bacterium]
MKRRKIIPYNPYLKKYARHLRNKSTLSEVLLWNRLRGKEMMGYDFHRQKPLDNYIVDFFCNELMLVIEIDGGYHYNRFKKDQIRQQKLEKLGLYSLRFKDGEIRQDIDNVLHVIENWIKEHFVGTSQEGENTPRPFGTPLSRGDKNEYINEI